jgi:hypothetical protein
VNKAVAVLDIDGTVADVRHRLHMIAGSPTHDDWLRFFEGAGTDTLIPEGAAVAHELAAEYTIVWYTGRPELVRELTEDWLRKHELPAGRLLMQRSDDPRLARVVKLEHLDKLSAEELVALVVDDDPRVVDFISAAGYRTRLADWMPWRPAGAAGPNR